MNIFEKLFDKKQTEQESHWKKHNDELSKVNYTDEVKSVLFGVAVGDALGVPVEFTSRQIIRKNPVTDMIGYGTFYLPEGTWSDDSSLTFCLAEALTQEFNLNTIGQNFVKWYHDNFWTPRIYSSGYVLHTLEASIWCLLTTDSFEEAVLRAVNLGEDTDTTGAVTGGLAGLLYGISSIPEKWLKKLARYDDISNLAERVADKSRQWVHP